MALPAQFVPLGFSLTAVFTWGISDFVGGYAAKRANAFLVTLIAHLSGMVLMGALAWLNHDAFPSRHAMEWALAAGTAGGFALAVFYRALAAGNMGLTAPVAAVLGAVIPTIFGILTEGLPGIAPIFGFALAAIGIWLISRAEISSKGESRRPAGLGLAVLAGIGFAGFYLFIKQAGDASGLWLLVASKLASAVITGAIFLLGQNSGGLNRSGASFGVVAGCLDVTGSFLFIRASQTGRLDSAVVISSLYPVITVLLARLILKEHFTRWKVVGMCAALLAVPLIAWS